MTTEQMQQEHVEVLVEQGFDSSEYDAEEKNYRVRCSQCVAMVVNGTATHEQGCYNKYQAERRAAQRGLEFDSAADYELEGE